MGARVGAVRASSRAAAPGEPLDGCPCASTRSERARRARACPDPTAPLAPDRPPDLPPELAPHLDLAPGAARAPESAPPPPEERTPPPEPAVGAPEEPRGEALLSLTELWVLDGALQGTLANEGDAPARAATWAMRLVPGYDADNDYGGESPPAIEAIGGRDDPIEAGATVVVTLAQAPPWYLDVQLHPMQLRARYRVEDETGALHESEQSARLVLFHVRSEGELDEIRDETGA